MIAFTLALVVAYERVKVSHRIPFASLCGVDMLASYQAFTVAE